MKFLTKKKFKAWLESKAPKTKVGYKCMTGDCPLAKFITQSTGHQCEVDGEIITLYPKGESDYKDHPAPEWARKFVELVDKDGAAWAYYTGSVSAKKALDILKKCA